MLFCQLLTAEGQGFPAAAESSLPTAVILGFLLIRFRRVQPGLGRRAAVASGQGLSSLTPGGAIHQGEDDCQAADPAADRPGEQPVQEEQRPGANQAQRPQPWQQPLPGAGCPIGFGILPGLFLRLLGGQAQKADRYLGHGRGQGKGALEFLKFFQRLPVGLQPGKGLFHFIERGKGGAFSFQFPEPGLSLPEGCFRPE